MNAEQKKKHFSGDYANCIAVTYVDTNRPFNERKEMLSSKFPKQANKLEAFAYASYWSEIHKMHYRVNRVVNGELWCIAIFENGIQVA